MAFAQVRIFIVPICFDNRGGGGVCFDDLMVRLHIYAYFPLSEEYKASSSDQTMIKMKNCNLEDKKKDKLNTSLNDRKKGVED